MYEVFDKNTIILKIIPHLSIVKRNYACKANIVEVNCILYKLKTGVQWHLLPVKAIVLATRPYFTIFGNDAKRANGSPFR